MAILYCSVDTWMAYRHCHPDFISDLTRADYRERNLKLIAPQRCVLLQFSENEDQQSNAVEE
jgi:hypothetical protein